MKDSSQSLQLLLSKRGSLDEATGSLRASLQTDSKAKEDKVFRTPFDACDTDNPSVSENNVHKNGDEDFNLSERLKNHQSNENPMNAPMNPMQGALPPRAKLSFNKTSIIKGLSSFISSLDQNTQQLGFACKEPLGRFRINENGSQTTTTFKPYPTPLTVTTQPSWGGTETNQKYAHPTRYSMTGANNSQAISGPAYTQPQHQRSQNSFRRSHNFSNPALNDTSGRAYPNFGQTMAFSRQNSLVPGNTPFDKPEKLNISPSRNGSGQMSSWNDINQLSSDVIGLGKNMAANSYSNTLASSAVTPSNIPSFSDALVSESPMKSTKYDNYIPSRARELSQKPSQDFPDLRGITANTGTSQGLYGTYQTKHNQQVGSSDNNFPSNLGNYANWKTSRGPSGNVSSQPAQGGLYKSPSLAYSQSALPALANNSLNGPIFSSQAYREPGRSSLGGGDSSAHKSNNPNFATFDSSAGYGQSNPFQSSSGPEGVFDSKPRQLAHQSSGYFNSSSSNYQASPYPTVEEIMQRYAK